MERKEYLISDLDIFSGGIVSLDFPESIQDARNQGNTSLYLELLPRVGLNPHWDAYLKDQTGYTLELRFFNHLAKPLREYSPEEVRDWQLKASRYQEEIERSIKIAYDNPERRNGDEVRKLPLGLLGKVCRELDLD